SIAYCPDSQYAANVELAEAVQPAPTGIAREPLAKVATPGVKTIAELAAFLKLPATRTAKAIVVDGADGRPVLLLLRGDHELNLIKAGKLDLVEKPVRFSTPEAIETAFGAHPGS